MYLIDKIREVAAVISPKCMIKLLYRYYFKKKLNLIDPRTLDEKIQWLKLNEYPYEKNPIYTICADKYKVREYVKEMGCRDNLNDLIAVYDRPEMIDWESLPNKFAIKWNFGNGMNIICYDKRNLNISDTINQLKKWGKKKAWTKTIEPQYRHIPKKIIIEKFIDDGNGAAPLDYKIYCFHGKPLYMFVCVGREKGKPKFYFFDREWNLARINPDSINAPEGFTLPKPKHLNTMFQIAEQLASKFKFVRVDLYDTEEKVYFGELTFTPGGGFDTSRLPETQILLGRHLYLNN